MTDGIHIPRDVADAEGVPDDLDASVVGPYRFPDPRRRRVSAWIYVGAAGLATVLAAFEESAWLAVGVLAILAVWHFLAAWPLIVDQEEALTSAARVVPFPIGHASAAVAFHGFRSRPRWQVVAYSADEPPSQRALAQFDAVNGEQLETVYIEDVPSV